VALTKNTLSFIGFENDYEESNLVLFGAPFDGTTSFRPGTRFGPMHMRNDSYGLETYSPYMDMDLEDYKLYDYGDLDFPFGNTKKVLDMIKDFSSKVVKANKIPLMIGGEHLVTLPAVESLYDKYKDLHIIRFDAHTDLRVDYMGEKLSHATVIRRTWDLLGDNKIHQFGIRSGLKEDFKWAKEHTNLNKFDFTNLDNTVESLKGKPVYVTIDLDILDPSVFCGTGTIEPGGVTFKELIDAIVLLKDLNIVGADVVELSPHYDQSGMSTAVACKVLRELTLSILSK
jgi:agmatinase